MSYKRLVLGSVAGLLLGALVAVVVGNALVEISVSAVFAIVRLLLRPCVAVVDANAPSAAVYGYCPSCLVRCDVAVVWNEVEAVRRTVKSFRARREW